MRFAVFAMKIDRKWLATYATLAFIMGSFLGGAMWNFAGIYVPDGPPMDAVTFGSLMRFASEEELVSFLQTRPQEYYGYVEDFQGGIPLSGKIRTNTISEAAVPSGTFDYSSTNIQVEGVDEADVVKTDGEYIYLVSKDRVIIVKAYPTEQASITATLQLNASVRDIYVNGDKLVIFQIPEILYFYEPWGFVPPEEFELTTNIYVYDISDRSSPALERKVRVDGFYANSRMIGDYVYAIANQPAILNDTEPILPKIRTEESTCLVEPEDIWYANNTDRYYGYTNIVAINVQDPEEGISVETFLLGSTSTLYVSLENIYLTAPWWFEEEDWGWEATMVYKIGIDGSDIRYLADGPVPGRVLNQFSMDEYGGYFRIATTNGHVTRNGDMTSNNVYVLNASLGIASRLEGLAPGERIYSARFMGGRCYLVTFKKVDPLFTIDLSDPENPEVLGKLKIPGYSDYLHPYDENHLIGIGKETEEAEQGDFAWYQGVKISLFDVSDVENPRELDKYEIGDRGTDSPALHEHKAFLFSRSRNLLVIPVLVAEIDARHYSGEVPPNAYGDYVYQGAYVFHVSPEQGIQLTGRVTHIEGNQAFLKSGYWFESEYSVERSLYIDEVLYTISQGMIKMNSLEDLSEVGRVILP
ncbi:MAG: beta-propeller domain-containing protein [Candidatus Bathyarchaeota archaeon]|nr:MAG: beta-propeller domain-containing protein [Candidatus Bathyarchaeota archaeon]